ncbi:unnamed protein product [Mytilus edulis]|uniref:Uncharacterized protein n=1 Tax=Mytilus edulis TaxID=6550 RepID=A0A8S3U7S1_MYTED|nr:unnamed protein product [Mytilus edulis]
MATSGDGEEKGRTLSRKMTDLSLFCYPVMQATRKKASSATQLEETTNKCMNLSDCYIDYLKRKNILDSQFRSQSSSTPRRSGRSNASCSSTMMRQKAQLEAARKRLEYVDEESTLMPNKAQLEANTTLEKAKLEKMTKELEAKRDVAVTEAELQSMEEVFDESDRETEVSSPSLTEQPTAKYIIEQSKHVNRQYEVHNSAPAVNNIDTQTFENNEENMNEELPVHNSAPAVNNINTQTLLRNEKNMNKELPIPLTSKIASPVTSANQIVQQIHKEVIEQLPDTNNNRTLSLTYGHELSNFYEKGLNNI